MSQRGKGVSRKIIARDGLFYNGFYLRVLLYGTYICVCLYICVCVYFSLCLHLCVSLYISYVSQRKKAHDRDGRKKSPLFRRVHIHRSRVPSGDAGELKNGSKFLCMYVFFSRFHQATLCSAIFVLTTSGIPYEEFAAYTVGAEMRRNRESAAESSDTFHTRVKTHSRDLTHRCRGLLDDA